MDDDDLIDDDDWILYSFNKNKNTFTIMFSEDNKLIIDQLSGLIEERFQLSLGLSNLIQQMKYNSCNLSMDYKSYIEFSQTARLGQYYKTI